MHRLKCIINVDASSIITCGHFKKKRTGNCIAIIQYKANHSTIWSDPCLLSPQSQPGQKVNSFKKMNVEQCKSSQDRRWAILKSELKPYLSFKENDSNMLHGEAMYVGDWALNHHSCSVIVPTGPQSTQTQTYDPSPVLLHTRKMRAEWL